MADEAPELVAAAWSGFRRAHDRLAAGVEADLVAANALSLAAFEGLHALDRADGGHLRIGELARRTGLTKSGVTRLVDRLERDGLARRLACPADRRAIHVEITAGGRAAYEAAAPIHSASVMRRFGRHLRCEEAQGFASAFERMGVRGDPGEPCGT